MSKIKWVLLLAVSWGLAMTWGSCQRTTSAPATDRQLVWSDDFEETSMPNTSNWAYDTGGWGWGNHELQYYTENRAENARLENGKLIIEAQKEEMEELGYTSARLVTKDRNTWQYGYIEIKAKLPTGKGTWPAIWMLGENIEEVGWPTCGEIDIMEHVGYEPDSIWGTLHCEAFNHMNGTQKVSGLEVIAVEDDFHVYAIDWREDRIDFFFDDQMYHSVRKPENASPKEWPFDAPHYLLLNIAVGGDWGGRHGIDTTIWPQRMEVDWVKVWQ